MIQYLIKILSQLEGHILKIDEQANTLSIKQIGPTKEIKAAQASAKREVELFSKLQRKSSTLISRRLNINELDLLLGEPFKELLNLLKVLKWKFMTQQ